MASGNEILFGRIAVYNGLITLKELEECIEYQRSNGLSEHLGQIILEHGLLDEAQARAILTMQRRRLHMGLRPERAALDEKVVNSLIAAGRLNEGQLTSARYDKSEMEDRGLFPSLGDILIQMGAVSLHEFSRAQRKTNPKALYCQSCGKKYRAIGYVPGKEAKCKKCGGKLGAQDASTSSAPAPKSKPRAQAQAVQVSGSRDPTPEEKHEKEKKEETALLSLNDVANVSLPMEVLGKRPKHKTAYRPKVGENFAGCLLEEKIGVGGMGEVYRARHLALDREVAVKVLPAQAVQQQHHIQRFFAEARSAAKLDHPNIVIVHDVGEDRGAYFIVMHLVPGDPVKDIITKNGSMTIRASLNIAKQTAEALDYAHSKNIVHRDVKTANIIVDDKGHVTIVDFGLTKDIASDSRLTSAGIVVGTVQYMSPEQAEGKNVDGRSDLYSLGITMFEMLTGSVPFTGESPWHVLTRHQKEPPPDIRQYRPEIPDRLASLIARLLAKTADARPGTGDAVAKEIDKVLKTVK